LFAYVKKVRLAIHDEDRILFQPQVLAERDLGVEIEVFATMNPDFVTSNGETVNKYWLDLREMPSLEVHKGLGVMKCRAVRSVPDEIRYWLAQHCR
jgi:hypothetical protein